MDCNSVLKLISLQQGLSSKTTQHSKEKKVSVNMQGFQLSHLTKLAWTPELLVSRTGTYYLL